MLLMTLDEWLNVERGRTARVATKLGVSGSLVTQWARGKQVSAERCVPIERATERAVLRWDLRPDDWHRIWPELIGTDGAPAVPQLAEEVRDAA
jgi:DNA-binding transcriptional regulator YdaS (Cro superfamily)